MGGGRGAGLSPGTGGAGVVGCGVGRAGGALPPRGPGPPRLLLVKADGSVSIHSEDRAYKPLNWMSPPCWLTEEPGVWTVRNKAGEQLEITIEEILHDSSHSLGAEPGLV